MGSSSTCFLAPPLSAVLSGIISTPLALPPSEHCPSPSCPAVPWHRTLLLRGDFDTGQYPPYPSHTHTHTHTPPLPANPISCSRSWQPSCGSRYGGKVLLFIFLHVGVMKVSNQKTVWTKGDQQGPGVTDSDQQGPAGTKKYVLFLGLSRDCVEFSCSERKASSD